MNKITQYQNFVFACLAIMIINLLVQITFGIFGMPTLIFSRFSWLVLALIIIAWIASKIHLGKSIAYREGYWKGRMETMEEFDERISKVEEASKKIKRRKTTYKRIKR